MKRRTFDKIMTAMGLGLTIFLFATAALLNWGASFASQSVTDQLTPQKIMFPAPDSEGLNALQLRNMLDNKLQLANKLAFTQLTTSAFT